MRRKVGWKHSKLPCCLKKLCLGSYGVLKPKLAIRASEESHVSQPDQEPWKPSLSFLIDLSHLIQHILLLKFSTQKVSPIALISEFWGPLKTNKSTAINKASFSFQGPELERGASQYIPRSTWFSSLAEDTLQLFLFPANGVSVAPFPRGVVGKNCL